MNQYVPFCVFIPLLILIGVYDFKFRKIPNKFTYSGAILAVVINIFFSETPIQYYLVGGLYAFVFAFILYRLGWAAGGDLKFITLVGLMFGHPWFLAVLAGAFMIGGMIMLVNHVAKLLRDDQNIPFAPYISVSGVVVSIWLMLVIYHG